MAKSSTFATCLLVFMESIYLINAFYCHSSTCQNFVTSMLESVNSKASPCTDFYHYSCSNNAVHSNNSRGDPMTLIESKLNMKLTDLLSKPPNSSENMAVHLVKTFYSSCINTHVREQHGNVELIKQLNKYGGWPILQNTSYNDTTDAGSVELLMGKLRNLGYSLFIRLNVKVDDRNPSRFISVLDVPKIELLPDYHSNVMAYIGVIGAQSTAIRNIVQLLGPKTLNDSMITQDIKNMLSFQMKLQQIVNRKGSEELKKVKRVIDLQSQVAKAFNWLDYLNAAFAEIKTFDSQSEILISDINYLSQLTQLLKSESPKVLKNYLLWQVVKDLAEDGDSKLRRAIALFRNSASNIQEICMKEAKGFLGYAASSLYLDNNNHQPTLSTIDNLVYLLKKSFSTLIHENSWMDSTTKAAAQIKLKSMNVKVGYPSWILNDAKLNNFHHKISTLGNNHLENIFAVSSFHTQQELTLIDATANSHRWEVSPLLTNAYYHRSANEVYIPIAILQEPLFHPDWPISANFGAIGSVMGHEMSHGFDAKSGDWWTHNASISFNAQARCVQQQYANYCVPNDDFKAVCVNGENTLVENIADIGGVKAASKGLWLWKSENEMSSSNLPSNVSDDVVFFLAYSKLWCNKLKPSSAFDQLMTSINSPNKYRLMGPLENLDTFTRTYNCTAFKKQFDCNIW